MDGFSLSGLFNIEKKEFTGTATSLNERKDLVAWIPDKTTNVRDALGSISILLKQIGGSLDRDIELVRKNYPGTDLNALNYQKIKDARAARQQQAPAQSPAAVNPPPPPPTPQAQPQAAPQSPVSPAAPQQAALPPIESQVEAAKTANPSEAAPKVGPNAPPKDAQAVLSTLPDSGASIHPRDKADLGAALSKWKKGALDDKQLELEVARVFMRTYGKKLEGQALNKAVAAWVAILKQSKKTTDVAKEGK